MSNYFRDNPLNSPINQWTPGCASDDFKNIAMGVYDSGDYGVSISNDYGSTWYSSKNGLTQNGSGTNASRSVICSNDFTRLTLVKENGNIFTSSDSGITWSKNALAAQNWFSVCGSIDLSKQAAVVNGGNIWISTNFGNTWANTTNNAGSRTWRGICCSSDFTKLAAVENNGNIYLSTNSGSSWTNNNAASGKRLWHNIACSTDGGNLVATVEDSTNGNVFISRDSGTTWGNIVLPSGANKSSAPVACSADFKNIIVGSNGQTNFIYSTDYGNTWTTDTNGLNTWYSCVVKGTKFAIGRLTASQPYVGQFNYDTSLYTVNGLPEQNLVKALPVIGGNSGLVVDRQLNYTNAFYRFDLSSGTDGTYTTQTSTGLDANATMGTTVLQSVFKNFTGSFPVSGAPSQVIDISNNLSGTPTNLASSVTMTSFPNISISLWIQPRVVSSAGKRFSIINLSQSSTTSVFDVLINGDTQKVQLNLNNIFTGTFATSTTSMVVGTWYHLVFTYNIQSGDGNIYINSVLESTVNYGISLNPYNVLLIGMRFGFNNTGTYVGYAGTLTYFNIFNREITQTEVNYLYNYPGQPFTNINTNSLSQLYGGGFPFLRGQAAFGESEYSKAVVKYNLSTLGVPNFAPFYTCYSAGGPYTHTLQSWTNRIFIICIGGGGGGGGGCYQNGGQSGGAGGGGGGGGMAYTYYSVSNNDTINVTVGAGGNGGQTAFNDGTYYYIGGNGINGNSSFVTINSTEVCRGFGGSRSVFLNNPSPSTSTKVWYPGDPSYNLSYLGSTWGGVYPANATTNVNSGLGGSGMSYTVNSNTGISGGANGIFGISGEKDPGNLSRLTIGGNGGGGGFNSGLQINSLNLIINSATITFLNSDNTKFCDGLTIRNIGDGGKGGSGEGGNTNNQMTPGTKGADGGVIIFEYSV